MNVKIENLKKKYNNNLILNDINLSIDGAHSIGIIGESGCGKSTLLRQLSGIEARDSGDIIIDNVSVIKNKREFQDRLGYVFQTHNLFPHLTIKENIMLILQKIKKYKDAEVRVDKALELLKIQNEADKKPHEVSGGQAQRASIARVLATDADLLFLDEPTASLDPILTNDVLSAVKNLKNLGKEFIFITHEIDFLRDFADYIIFMKCGKIIEHGDISCLKHPKTQELAHFLSNELKFKR